MRSTVACLALVAALGLGPGLAGGDGDRTSAPRPGEDPAYTQAVRAIEAGQYKAAVPLLEGVVTRDQRNADAYNWLAYAVRKDGDPARAIPIYQQALALDPKHRGAHEYIGEAYLMANNLTKAEEHLAALQRICLIPCEEYEDLKKAVSDYRARAPK